MSEINQIERASRAWPILADVAANHDTITYSSLGRKLGIHHRAVRYVLGEIQDYCMSEKMPPITILVVGGKGKPGQGFIAWDVNDLSHGQELVYRYPWQSVTNPFAFAADGATVESVAEAIVRHRISPREAYARVRVRGMAQQIFRESLMRAYGYRCAVSGITTRELLEAAHIIPWGDASPDQRINPQNGVLLSVLHHKFFDLRWLVINPDYSIEVKVKKTPKGSPEREILKSLHGSRLRLPSDQNLWPNPEYLRTRNEAA